MYIDDGSPDSSGEICDQYAVSDQRVRVFHKPNGGVSSARQCGIDNSQGEYTIHADPDDWVEPDMLQELYAEAKRSNADMVICDFIQEYGNGKAKYISQKPIALDSETLLQQFLFQQLHSSCWNKLVKKDCYNKGDIKFSTQVIRWEDLLVNCELLLNNISIAYINKPFYHYDLSINNESIVRKPSLKGVESQFFVCDYIEKLLSFTDYSWKEDALYILKSSTKNLMYFSNLYTNSDVVEKYRDINSRYISENLKIKTLKQILDIKYHLALLLSGHIFLSNLLTSIYRILFKLKTIVLCLK